MLCLTLALGLGVAEPAADYAAAATGSEQTLIRLINRSRRSRGLRALKTSARLTRAAHRHSARMASRGYIYHSCLSCLMNASGVSWHWAGENVATGSKIGGVHRALMNSTVHRSNILKAGARRVGAGVVRRSGRLWVTEVIYY